jgi:hypothetical protein
MRRPVRLALLAALLAGIQPAAVPAQSALPRPGPPQEPPALDRIVGRRPNSLPVMLRGVVELPDLAAAAHVPMGVEYVPPTQPRVLTQGNGTMVTGMALRDALAALAALDPRYEWREMDGVIVVRPISVWADTAHPLYRELGAAHLADATLQDAVALEQTLLEPGMRNPPPSQNVDVTVTRFSVDVPAGPLLTLANAIVRAHGSACWIYEELNERETAFFAGRSHQLSLQGRDGDALGFAFR